MANPKKGKNNVWQEHVGLVPYKICEKICFEVRHSKTLMAALLDSDFNNSDLENQQVDHGSDSESDISVSTVNTEDLQYRSEISEPSN